MSRDEASSEVKLATYKRTWAPMAKAAAWAAGIAGAFLTAPAQYALDQSSTPAVIFLQFATAVVFGLVFSAQTRSRSKKSRKRHLVYLAASFTALILLFYFYFFLQQQWSCLFAQRFLLVTGVNLTPDAAHYLANRPSLPPTCQSLLAEYAGNNLAVWDNNSILVRHISLTLLFSLAWLSCVSTFILTIEYVKTAPGPSPNRRPTTGGL